MCTEDGLLLRCRSNCVDSAAMIVKAIGVQGLSRDAWYKGEDCLVRECMVKWVRTEQLSGAAKGRPVWWLQKEDGLVARCHLVVWI